MFVQSKIFRLLLCSLALGLVSPVAPAQTVASPYEARLRTFPADAPKGILSTPIQNIVVINNKAFNAASGLQIKNENNLIVMPATLQGNYPIRFQFDQTGNVWRIWILTAAEQAVIDPKK